MIGKKMADLLLEGRTLRFYRWEDEESGAALDVKALLDGVRVKVDELASGWSEEEKQQCMEETMSCFRYGGSLMRCMQGDDDEGPNHANE